MTESEPKAGISIDIEADGKQFGHLSVPHSRNESGWGALHLPIVSIRNGSGPTVAFTGGNHGDEYEGPIALLKLARALAPSQVSGRVIVIPALNYPAVMGGTRVSPIDGVNMNRAFPGRRDGSVSQMIAHFVQHRILPVCDALFDIHSGGKTMMFSPFACYHRLADEALTRRARDAVAAMAAPISLELVELDAEGMLDTCGRGDGQALRRHGARRGRHDDHRDRGHRRDRDPKPPRPPGCHRRRASEPGGPRPCRPAARCTCPIRAAT